MVGAVIVGAGEGKRMGASGRKQFVKIAGKPIIAHTVDVFERSALIDHIVIVVPMDAVDWVKEDVVAAYGLKKVHAVVYGGASRQESVLNGLKALKPGTERVIIHDAVRPLVSDTLIRRVLDASQKTGAAVTAVPPKDTVKRVESGEIVGTLDRRLLWLAQTPQSFKFDLILAAHTKAAAEKFEGTDDASIVERAGTKVAVAVGSYSNLKMTSPEDLPMFEYFLGQDVKAKLDSAVAQGRGTGGGGGAGGGGGEGGRRPRHRRRRPRGRTGGKDAADAPRGPRPPRERGGREHGSRDQAGRGERGGREHGGREPGGREHAGRDHGGKEPSRETKVAQNRDGIRHP
jgi:2-C-methyl-D-erythritol 4-phosphate cytidylyltransferase